MKLKNEFRYPLFIVALAVLGFPRLQILLFSALRYNFRLKITICKNRKKYWNHQMKT